MKEKKCFKCGEVKAITDFYAHSQMSDGHLGKCKSCTKTDTKTRAYEKAKDPAWLESEREEYKGKYDQLPEQKAESVLKYKEKWPEKYYAKNASQRIKIKPGYNRHHWSYNEEHWKDILELSIKDHNKAHVWMQYDQERMMFRRVDSMELLDTKEKHLKYIEYVLQQRPD